jgi:hypothetical protein
MLKVGLNLTPPDAPVSRTGSSPTSSRAMRPRLNPHHTISIVIFIALLVYTVAPDTPMECTGLHRASVRSTLVRYQRGKMCIGHVRWGTIKHTPASGDHSASPCAYVICTRRWCTASGRLRPLPRKNASDAPVYRGQHPLAQALHARLCLNWSDAQSLRGQHLVTSSDLFRLYFFAEVSTFLFLSEALQMCQPPCVSPCARMLAYFHKHFRELC